MAWVFLIFAIVLEIMWVATLKSTEGFSRLLPSFLTVLIATGSVACLSLAVRTIPLAVGYGIWVGAGAVGAVLIETLFHDQLGSLTRNIAIVLIVGGIILLKFSAIERSWT
jgi:quaternary ammonium compound-resistance protein SugE